jgi:hypothetical protein
LLLFPANTASQVALTGSLKVTLNWPLELVATRTIQYQVELPLGRRSIEMTWPP